MKIVNTKYTARETRRIFLTLSDNLNEFMMNFTDIAREALFAFLCFACFVTNITVVGVDEFNDAGRLLVFYSVWIKIDLPGVKIRSVSALGNIDDSQLHHMNRQTV